MKYALTLVWFALAPAGIRVGTGLAVITGLAVGTGLLATGLNRAPAVAAETDRAEVIEVLGAAKLAIPENWQRVRPMSTMIEHEYQIKDGEGDDAPTARITMMAAGGDIKANVDRWKGQMPGGDPAEQKTEEKKMGDWTVHIVDLSGNYRETMGGGGPFSGGRTVERKNYAMLGLILVDETGRKYFIKATGPRELIQANREAALKMLQPLEG